MDIFALSNFQMKADVRIDNLSKPLEGKLSLLWNGPDEWKEEITFPGYTETYVGSKGNVFLKRPTTYMPYMIYELHRTLGFSAAAISGGSSFDESLRPQESVKKVREEKIHGAKADCVEVDTGQPSTREVCISQATGTLIREKALFVDKDLVEVGSKVFPRSLSFVENGRPLVEVHINEIRTGEPISRNSFDPPAGAVSASGCMNPVPGRVISRVQPRYPEEDKRDRRQGTVAIYTVIDTAGVPQNLQISREAGSTLNKASLDAVSQWRYEPSTCNGQPVATETVIEVHYTLSSF